MRNKSHKPTKNGFKILLKYLFEYKNEIILLSVLGVISGIANAFVPFIVGSFFDAVLDVSNQITRFGRTVPLWVFLVGIFALIQVVASSVDWVIDKKSRKMSTLVHATYPAKASARLLKLPVSFYKTNKTGDVWDRIIRASNSLSNLIGNVVITIAPQILSVIFGIVIAFYINHILALILIVGIILYIITLYKIVPPIVKFQREGNRRWNRSYGHAYDAVMNFQTVKQSGAEIYEEKRIYNKFIHAFKSWYKVEEIWAGINFYQRIIVVVTQLAVFVVSVGFIQNGTLTIGGLIALNGYSAMVFGPFVVLGRNWQTIQNGIVALERAEKMLENPTEQYIFNKNSEMKGLAGSVEFKNVDFSYKKSDPTVLNNISFKIQAGDIVALVGESGVGKSTAMELVSGYYFPTKGKVLIDGYDTKKTGLASLRKQVAIVPQEPVLFNDTIKSNIKYGVPSTSDEDVEYASHKAHADIFIDAFSKKYNQVVGERGVRLSVGQKQRVAIARAILRDPKILILDEPTSALDAKTERFITESLEELMRGRTTFIIAHRLSTARKADKILVFKAGEIVESGKHEELMQIQNGVYRHLYEYQIGLK